MEFDLKVRNEMDFFLKLDKDLATKLLSSQKAPWPTFSTCFKAMPKGPAPALMKEISPEIAH